MPDSNQERSGYLFLPERLGSLGDKKLGPCDSVTEGPTKTPIKAFFKVVGCTWLSPGRWVALFTLSPWDGKVELILIFIYFVSWLD